MKTGQTTLLILLGLVALMMVKQWPEISRYLKMRSM
jgi:hypothetical protein